jgi:AMP-polyphosphate phosphotransferase
MGRLDELDLSLKLTKRQENERLTAASNRLAQIRLAIGGKFPGHPDIGPGMLVLFEGWDASGKGGAIKRLVGPMDPRHVRVKGYAAPTSDEKRHHFLHRFASGIPGLGGFAVLDRTWYGRVLVERVEGFATEEQWRRAYSEIRSYESMLRGEGVLVLKFWMHVSDEEQERRFRSRAADPLKTWKLTDEDWRNRARRTDYATAVEEMLRETDTPEAPWVLVEADDKRYARVKVVESVIAHLETGCEDLGFALPAPL